MSYQSEGGGGTTTRGISNCGGVPLGRFLSLAWTDPLALNVAKSTESEIKYTNVFTQGSRILLLYCFQKQDSIV